VVGEESLDWLAEKLDDSLHLPVVPKKMVSKLRRATTLERKVLDLEDWKKGKEASS
jgi:hypothetical protein